MLGSVVANRQPGKHAVREILITAAAIGTIMLRHSNGFQQYKSLHTLKDISFLNFPELTNGRKFELIFRSTPPWLLWFTYVDAAAHVLGIKVPDLSNVSCFMRDERNALDIPKGPFECRPWPDGVYDKFADQKQKRRALISEEMTPRERKRVLRICGLG
jgi:hypothetical protein